MTSAALLLALALSAQPDGGYGDKRKGGGWRERCSPEVAAAFTEVERALKDLESDLEDLDSKREQRRLADEVARFKRVVEQARDTSCAGSIKSPVVVAPPPPVVVAPPPPPPRQPIVMTSGAFAELKAAITRESFDDGKQRLLELGVQGETCVTVDQAKQLMGLGSFSEWKIAVVRHMAPRLVDRDRAFMLPQGLSFPTDKEAVSKILSSTPTLDVCRPR
jgi:hypothetical protein